MFKLIDNFIVTRKVRNYQYYFERGFGAACFSLMYNKHPLDYVLDQVIDDGVNEAFNHGWLAACSEYEELTGTSE